jgi:serine/threonine-protein kinase PRP4
MGRQSTYEHGDVRDRESRDQSVSKRAHSPLPAGNARHEAKTTQGYPQQHNNKPASDLELEK